MENQLEQKRSLTVRVVLSLSLFVVWFCFFSSGRLNYTTYNDIYLHAQAALEMGNFPRYGFGRLAAFRQSLSLPHTLSYPVWHILFLLLYNVFQAAAGFFANTPLDVDRCIWLASGLENTALQVLTFNLLLSLLQKEFSIPWKSACFYAVTLMFVGPLYVPAINQNYSLGQLTANPWHNPTYILIKPLAIICFWLFYRLYSSRGDLSGTVREKLMDRRENRDFLLLSLCILASAFCKPNFYQVFVPGLFLLCVFDVLHTRFKSLIFCIKTGLAVIPVCLLMLIQYSMAFTAQGNGIVIAPLQVWKLYTPHCAGSFLISVVFPLAVLLLCRRAVQKQSAAARIMLIAIMVFVSAMAQFMLLSVETGYYAGDFEWGVCLALLLVFASAIFWLEEYRKQNGRDWRCLLVLAVYGLHTVCGAGYFISLF